MAPNHSCSLDMLSAVFLPVLGSIAFGLHLATAGMTFYIAHKQSRDFRRYYIYIGLLVVLSSVNYCFCMAQFIYLEGTTNYKELYSYHNSDHYWPLIALPEIMALVVTILCNSLMMVRCYVVWDAWKPILILPALLFCGLIGSALFLIISRAAELPCVTYWPLQMALNWTLSIMICGRIIWIRKRAQKLLGKEHKIPGRPGMLPLVIESSLIYTVVTAFGGFNTFASGVPYPFSPLLVQAECIATELIILRVILGQAVTRGWTTTAFTVQVTTVPNPDRPHTPAQTSEPTPELKTVMKQHD